MANIYVDPSAATNGSGTETSPRNIWPTSIGAGDVIYLKRGTTLTVASQLTLGAGSNNEVRDYGSGDMPIITSSASNFGQINVDRSGVTTFRNIWFKNCQGGSANGGVIVASPVSASRVANLAIYNCKFTGTGYNAIRLNGTDTATAASTFVCKYCIFDDIGEDCVYGGALDFEFSHNTCTRLSTRTETGDGVGFISADPTRVLVLNNYIDHSGKDVKQCIIVDTATGVGDVLIEGNTLIGYGSATDTADTHSVILVDCKATIRRNTIYSFGLAAGLEVADSTFTDNLVIIGNARTSAPVVALSASTTSVNSNTFVSLKTLEATQKIVTQAASLSGCVVKNNVFVNVPIAIQSDTVGNNPTATHNAFWNVTTARRAQDGTTFSGGNDITTDPLLSDVYKLKVGSPLIGTGTHLGYTRDIERKQRPNPPSIGAYDVATLRTPT